MKFVLVMYVLSGGQADRYVMDSGLTYEDCHAAIVRSIPDDSKPLVCEFSPQDKARLFGGWTLSNDELTELESGSDH